MNADQVKELLSNATPGPWAYRPHKHDDWGFVRGPDGYLTAKAWNGAGVYEASAESDPFEGNARLIAAAPAVAQWGLERDAEASWLRILLAQAVKDYDVGAWRHSARGGDDYPEPNWVTHARGILGGTS